MSPVFNTDTSIALRGVSRPFDPIAAFSRIANLRRLQQRGQINQLQLEDLESERERQKAIREAALGSGGDRAQFLQRLSQVAPLARFGFEETFAKQARAKEKDQAALLISKLEGDLATYEIIAREAAPIKAAEERGLSDDALQVMYAGALANLRPEIAAKLPKIYERGFARDAILESIPAIEQIKNALRAAELEERKRAEKVRTEDRAAVRALTARGLDIQEAKDPDRARKIRNREALMIGATATDYLTEANGDPDEALALLEEELRLPTASAEFRRLAPKIRNRIRERVRPGRSRRSTEGDRLQEILGPLEQ